MPLTKLGRFPRRWAGAIGRGLLLLCLLCLLTCQHAAALSGHAVDINGASTFLESEAPVSGFPSTAISFGFWRNCAVSGRNGGQFLVYSEPPLFDADVAPFSVYGYELMTLAIGGAEIPTACPGTEAGWRHFGGSWSSTTGQLIVYCDGQQQILPEAYKAGFVLPAGGRLEFGKERYHEKFFGRFDEIAIFDAILPAESFALLRTHPLALAAVFATSGVVHYTFDAEADANAAAGLGSALHAGDRVLDSSGRGNHARVALSSRGSLLIPSTAPTWSSNTTVLRIPAGSAAAGSALFEVPLLPSVYAGDVDAPPAFGGQAVSVMRLSQGVNASAAAALDCFLATRDPQSGDLQRLASAPELNASSLDVPRPIAGAAAAAGSLLCRLDTALAESGGVLQAGRAFARLQVQTQSMAAHMVVLELGTPPQPHPYSLLVTEDTSMTFILIWNNYPSLFLEGVDSDGASLMAYLTRLPGSGALSQLDGTPIASVPALVRDPYSRLQYTPERNANGDALTSFDFVVSNGFQNSTQTTVTIDVVGVPDAPSVKARSLGVYQDTELALTLPITDAEGDLPYVTITRLPQHGTLFQVNEDGSRGPPIADQGANTLSLQQWASRVGGFSSQYTNDSWGAVQALGPPDRFPYYGDSALAWAGSTAETAEWLHVSYDTPVFVSNVASFVVYSPGYLVNISALSPRGTWHLIWQSEINDALTQKQAAHIQNAFTCPMNFPTKDLKIHTAPAPTSWVEIDAIMMQGQLSIPSNVVQNLDSKLVYVPEPGFSGQDSFQYTTNDCSFFSTFGNFAQPSAVIQLKVVQTNHAPLQESFQALVEDTGMVEVKLAALDLENDTVTFAVNSLPSRGKLLVPRTVGGGSKGTTLAPLTQSVIGASGYPLPGQLFYKPDVQCDLAVQSHLIDHFNTSSSDNFLLSAGQVQHTIIIQCTQLPLFGADVTLRAVLPAAGGASCLLTMGLAGALALRGQHRVVRAASLSFSLLMLLGLLLMALHSTATGRYPPSLDSCVSHTIFGHLGFVLAFSALFAKTWRIKRIFGQRKFSTVKITDAQLFKRGVAPAVAVMALYLVVWLAAATPAPQTVDSPRSRSVSSVTTSGAGGAGAVSEVVVRVIEQESVCRSEAGAWQIIPLVAEFVMLLWGTHLTISIRKTPAEFNESKNIAVVLLIALLAHFARVALVVFGLNPTPDTAYIVEALADQAIVLSISLLLIGPLIVMAYPSLRCCRLLVSLFSNSSNGDSNREPDGSGGDKKKAADTSNSGGRAAKSLFDRKELINLCRLAEEEIRQRQGGGVGSEISPRIGSGLDSSGGPTLTLAPLGALTMQRSVSNGGESERERHSSRTATTLNSGGAGAHGHAALGSYQSETVAGAGAAAASARAASSLGARAESAAGTSAAAAAAPGSAAAAGSVLSPAGFTVQVSSPHDGSARSRSRSSTLTGQGQGQGQSLLATAAAQAAVQLPGAVSSSRPTSQLEDEPAAGSAGTGAAAAGQSQPQHGAAQPDTAAAAAAGSHPHPHPQSATPPLGSGPGTVPHHFTFVPSSRATGAGAATAASLGTGAAGATGGGAHAHASGLSRLHSHGSHSALLTPGLGSGMSSSLAAMPEAGTPQAFVLQYYELVLNRVQHYLQSEVLHSLEVINRLQSRRVQLLAEPQPGGKKRLAGAGSAGPNKTSGKDESGGSAPESELPEESLSLQSPSSAGETKQQGGGPGGPASSQKEKDRDREKGVVVNVTGPRVRSFSAMAKLHLAQLQRLAENLESMYSAPLRNFLRSYFYSRPASSMRPSAPLVAPAALLSPAVAGGGAGTPVGAGAGPRLRGQSPGVQQGHGQGHGMRAGSPLVGAAGTPVARLARRNSEDRSKRAAVTPTKQQPEGAGGSAAAAGTGATGAAAGAGAPTVLQTSSPPLVGKPGLLESPKSRAHGSLNSSRYRVS